MGSALSPPGRHRPEAGDLLQAPGCPQDGSASGLSPQGDRRVAKNEGTRIRPIAGCPHVLVVEDHAPLRAQIVDLLERAGLQVDEAADGRIALQSVLAQPPDLLLLDLNLPGLDGLALCRQLRRQAPCHVPVLMLTARDALADKLGGFDAGADDYLVKPFAGEELLVRVQALLRRRTLGQDYLLRVGALEIDRRAQGACRNGRRLALPPKAFAILLLLAEAWPRALTRSDIIHRLWDDEAPESDPLRSHLYVLRQQLDRPFDQPMLQTVHGVGFRLNVDVVDGSAA